MADFQPPPTWALPILVDERTKTTKFNPVWLQWFVDLVAIVNASGGGSGTILHNSTGSLQGGTANEYYHLTSAFFNSLTGVSGTASFLAATVSAGRLQRKQGASVASANNLTVGTDGDYFQITGATQINLLDSTSFQGGADITVKFNGAPLVKHNQAVSGAFKPIMLNGGVDFATAASNTLTLVYDSTDAKWYETGRKV